MLPTCSLHPKKGSGVLSLPFALAHAGFALGVSGLILFACLSIQGILLMVDCAQLVERKKGKGVQTYPALATALVGRTRHDYCFQSK